MFCSTSVRKFHLLLFVFFTGISSYVFAQNSNIVPGNLIVMLSSEQDARILSEELYYVNGIRTGLKHQRALSRSMNIHLFEFNSSAIHEDILLNIVRSHPLVKIVQFNHIFQERVIPNDTQFGVMWDMNNTGQSGGTADADIDAPEAWDITTGGLSSQGDTLVVAVVDGGFDLGHQDLKFWKNYKEIPNNSIDDDGNGYVDDRDGWNGATGTDNFSSLNHGTHVTGTVAAKGNNGIGVTGVNWDLQVMAVSYGSGGSGLEANTIASYSYIYDQRKLFNQTNGLKGTFVVATNSSFGIDLGKPADYPMWCAMYDSLGSVGILSAGATSNSNNNVDTQGDIPTACPSNWLVTVTNTNRNDGKATAGYGATTIDLGAPGTSITSTYTSNTYSSSSGTSMATPHVAGAIALMLSVPCTPLINNYKADPAGTALIIKDSLLNAVDPASSLSGITVTGGRLNIFKAVKSMQNYCVDVSLNDEPLHYPFEIRNIYPNPASHLVNIVYSSDEPVEISIVNVLGQEVQCTATSNSKGIQHASVHFDNIEKGIYFVNLYSGEKKSNVVKFIVY